MTTRNRATDPVWLTDRAERINQRITEKEPVGYNLDGANDIVLIDNHPDELTKAMRTLARDAVTSHPCDLNAKAGIRVCRHPDHQRDHDGLSEALQALGLIPRREALKPAKRLSKRAVDRAAKVSRLKPRDPDADSSWQDDAACSGKDLFFFGPDGERLPEREIREREAKRVCRDCPVRSACLNYAIASKAVDGVWGGLNEDERASERRRRVRRGQAA